MCFTTIFERISYHIQRFFIEAIATGPIPQHVAFIMDGNRRYAKKKKKEKLYGHSQGWKSLEKTLVSCFGIGIRIVTVYAFSIENFKRDPDEVAYLFNMIIEKLNLLAKESSTIGIYKLRIRILGQIDLLPLNVQRAAFEAEKATLNNSGCLLNICIPYTSRQELLQAVEKSTPPYTSHRFESYLYTGHVPTIDVLIRTCGDHRLSDFMLYQCNDGCQLEFVQHAWPEFTFWDLLPILAEFQLHALAQRHVPTLLLNTNLIKNIPWDEFRYDVSIRSEEMEQPSGS